MIPTSHAVSLFQTDLRPVAWQHPQAFLVLLGPHYFLLRKRTKLHCAPPSPLPGQRTKWHLLHAGHAPNKLQSLIEPPNAICVSYGSTSAAHRPETRHTMLFLRITTTIFGGFANHAGSQPRSSLEGSNNREGTTAVHVRNCTPENFLRISSTKNGRLNSRHRKITRKQETFLRSGCRIKNAWKQCAAPVQR